MAHYRGRRATRRKNLQRNLARLRDLPEPAPEAPLDLPPDRPGDVSRLAADVLAGALRLSGMSRGLIALRVPRSGPRFRVVQRLGFSQPATHLTGMLRVMGHTLRSGAPVQLCGDLLSADASDLGTTVSVPLLVNGALVGALVLDDPERNTPLSDATSTHLLEFARHSAAILSARLTRHAPERLSA